MNDWLDPGFPQISRLPFSHTPLLRKHSGCLGPVVPPDYQCSLVDSMACKDGGSFPFFLQLNQFQLRQTCSPMSYLISSLFPLHLLILVQLDQKKNFLTRVDSMELNKEYRG